MTYLGASSKKFASIISAAMPGFYGFIQCRKTFCALLSLSSLNKTANDGRYDPCTNVVGIHTAAFSVSSKCNALKYMREIKILGMDDGHLVFLHTG